ncbi:translation initiation factor [Bacteroidia bacterium]|jgi:translation initiation factor 1|nr:translation initiation factor [Bacteroidota bacterium]MDB4173723.1 translation initiation factor [Bacteroidia bacterium]
MSKKKMQKLDLSTFFVNQQEDDGFIVLSDNDGAKEKPTVNLPANAQKLSVRKEKKGRGGKTVTVIEGYQGNPQTLEALCKKVKQQCGVGGSVDRKTFIIQGNKADQVVKILIKEGYNAKKTTM